MIGAAMAEASVVGIGRLTFSRRERMVMVEPRGTGMALFTLRAADEVRPTQFGPAEGDLGAEMVAIARAIIRQRSGTFDPIGDPTLADAILDRIIRNAHRLQLKGDSLRKQTAAKTLTLDVPTQG